MGKRPRSKKGAEKNTLMFSSTFSLIFYKFFFDFDKNINFLTIAYSGEFRLSKDKMMNIFKVKFMIG